MQTKHRFLRGVLLVALVLLAAGCAGVNRLREAQDAFNQAAAADNAVRFGATQHMDGDASGLPASWSVARNGYASALLSLEQLETSEDQARLHEDGLWGTVLTLKALCQWRLGLFDQALATADEARENAGDQIYPRDRAVIDALPGLIKTDQAYLEIAAAGPAADPSLLADLKALLVGPNGAVADIQTAREAADKDHPVQVYLIQAQLAAYRDFMVALDRLQNHATVPTAAPVRVAANTQLAELSRLVVQLNLGQAGKNMIDYWVDLCALDRP